MQKKRFEKGFLAEIFSLCASERLLIYLHPIFSQNCKCSVLGCLNVERNLRTFLFFFVSALAKFFDYLFIRMKKNEDFLVVLLKDSKKYFCTCPNVPFWKVLKQCVKILDHTREWSKLNIIGFELWSFLINNISLGLRCFGFLKKTEYHETTFMRTVTFS